MRNVLAVALVVAGVLAVAGCNGSSEQARLRHLATQSGGNTGAAQPDDPTSDMVNAVSTADGKPPVYLKFRLVTAPQVGQPLELQIALIQEPKLEIDTLKVSLQPREGLQLKSASPIDLGKPGIGATHMIPVTLLPLQAGVLSLAVTVLVDTERETLTRGYTVPVLVLPAQPAASETQGGAGTAPAAPAARAAPATRSRTR